MEERTVMLHLMKAERVIPRQFRTVFPQSKWFTGVLSEGKIHCLRNLRKEGFPDFHRFR